MNNFFSAEIHCGIVQFETARRGNSCLLPTSRTTRGRDIGVEEEQMPASDPESEENGDEENESEQGEEAEQPEELGGRHRLQ